MTENPLAIVEQGDLAYREHDYERAKLLYEKALALATEQGAETNYIYGCLARVEKRTRDHAEALALAERALPTPAAFRDCAISLRAMTRAAVGRDDTPAAEAALNRLYRLGVLAAVCYGSHDCKSGVIGREYDRAILIAKALPLGRITDTYRARGVIAGGLLTKRDWDVFRKVFGAVDTIFDPQVEYRQLLQRVDEKAARVKAARRASYKLPGFD